MFLTGQVFPTPWDEPQNSGFQTKVDIVLFRMVNGMIKQELLGITGTILYGFRQLSQSFTMTRIKCSNVSRGNESNTFN